MFKLHLVSFMIMLSIFFSMIHAKCCLPTVVKFISERKSCQNFNAINAASGIGIYGYTNPRNCKIIVCGDGKRLTGSSFCGKGPCNIIGCDCDEGCIEGNPVENFKAIHNSDVNSVRL